MEISVCIPAYNAEKTIARTLRNLQFQSLKEFKILIYDDGSTDNTYKIVREMSCKDPRIVLVRSEINKGRSEARNALLNLVNEASMIAWQDADDLWHPQKLLIQSKIYVENMHDRTKDIIYTSIFRKPYFPNDEKKSRAEIIFGPQKPMRIDHPLIMMRSMFFQGGLVCVRFTYKEPLVLRVLIWISEVLIRTSNGQKTLILP